MSLCKCNIKEIAYTVSDMQEIQTERALSTISCIISKLGVDEPKKCLSQGRLCPLYSKRESQGIAALYQTQSANHQPRRQSIKEIISNRLNSLLETIGIDFNPIISTRLKHITGHDTLSCSNQVRRLPFL